MLGTLTGPFKHFVLIGAILLFLVSRWMKKEWIRRMKIIQRRFGDPYKRIREIGESPDFLQNIPTNLFRMDQFAQGDIGTAQMVFVGCSIIWFGIWLILVF
jgi:hypothetical protein